MSLFVGHCPNHILTPNRTPLQLSLYPRPIPRPTQHLLLHLLNILPTQAIRPLEISQPRLPLLLGLCLAIDPPRIPLQTAARNVAVRQDVFDQRLLGHVVEFRADEAEHEQIQGRVVEVGVELVQHVDLDAARLVGVERVVAYGQDAGVDARGARVWVVGARMGCGGFGGVGGGGEGC